jgi:hypothetical protein
MSARIDQLAALDAELTHSLNLTTQDVDFHQMEHDIERFASEPSVRSVLELGVDLQNYSSEIATNLETAESASIDDYLHQAPQVSRLKQEIKTCDVALEEMGTLLRQFKLSLGQLSSDIYALQTRSHDITVRLQNRKSLEHHLEEFTRELNIPNDLSDRIYNTELGPSYIKVMSELSSKLNYISRKEVRPSLAAQETFVLLDRLRIRAADNIRRWIISRVSDFKLGGSDRLSMQNLMIRCKPLFRFLKSHAPDVQQSSVEYYIDVVSRIFTEKYQRATANVTRKMSQVSMALETIVPSKNSTIKQVNSRELTLFFSLGERAKLLTDMFGAPPRFKGDSYPLEMLVRGLYQSLINHVTSEYAFTSEFFDDDNITLEIFTPTVHHLEQFLEELIGKVTDPICIALLLRFVHACKAEMERRYIFKIDQHLTTIHQQFAERFRAIIALNKRGVEATDPRIFMDNEETAHLANAMTRRFVEFAKSISVLIIDELADLMVPELHLIAASVIDLLEKIAKGFRGPGMSNVFLINNYHLALTILKPVHECMIVGLFELKLADCSAEYIEIEIETAFKKLAKMITRAFTRIELREEPKLKGIDESELKEIAVDFKTSHVEKIRKISELQMVRFGDFMNGKRIFGLLTKRIVLYWTKFEQLCRAVVRNKPQPQWFSLLLSTQQLVNDLRPFTDGGF